MAIFACLLFITLLKHSIGAEKCNYDAAAIEEQYMYLLGRNATKDEIQRYGATVQQGKQIAYYEPYFNVTGFAQSSAWPCTEWIGYSVIPESIPDTHTEELRSRGGKDSTLIASLLRSIWCILPDSELVKEWTSAYTKLISEAGKNEIESLEQIAHELASLAPDNLPICPGAINDIYSRLLGREIRLSGCNFTQIEDNCDYGNAAYSFDCCEYSLFINGSVSSNDVIHHVRSQFEYISYNEASFCYEQYPLPDYYMQYPQLDPHAIGEYVTQMYRVLLGRRPDSTEMASIVNTYTGGSTKEFLSDLSSVLVGKCGEKIVHYN